MPGNFLHPTIFKDSPRVHARCRIAKCCTQEPEHPVSALAHDGRAKSERKIEQKVGAQDRPRPPFLPMTFEPNVAICFQCY
jgi:hypothetical protein